MASLELYFDLRSPYTYMATTQIAGMAAGVTEHFARLAEHPAFAPDVRPHLQHLGLI
jgi:2-hydroxychromene-2-carboxylate isomerase